MLKKNSKDTLDIIAGQTKRNAKAAYKATHPDASDATASVNVAQLLKKPEAQIYLEEHVQKASNKIVELIDSDKPDIALRASTDVLDRNRGKAVSTVVTHTEGVTLTIDLTSALAAQSNP